MTTTPVTPVTPTSATPAVKNLAPEVALLAGMRSILTGAHQITITAGRIDLIGPHDGPIHALIDRLELPRTPERDFDMPPQHGSPAKICRLWCGTWAELNVQVITLQDVPANLAAIQAEISDAQVEEDAA